MLEITVSSKKFPEACKAPAQIVHLDPVDGKEYTAIRTLLAAHMRFTQEQGNTCPQHRNGGVQAWVLVLDRRPPGLEHLRSYVQCIGVACPAAR